MENGAHLHTRRKIHINQENKTAYLVKNLLKQLARHQLSHHLLLNNRQRLEILFACHQFDQYMKNTYKKGIQTVVSHIILSPIPTQITISILYTSLNRSILLIYLSCTFGSLFWKYWYTFKVISIQNASIQMKHTHCTSIMLMNLVSFKKLINVFS